MKTTNIITGAVLLLSCALQGSAVPAYPGMITFRQADGEEISIRRIGDEIPQHGSYRRRACHTVQFRHTQL